MPPVDTTPETPATEQVVTASAEDEFSAAFTKYTSPGEAPVATETAPASEPEAQQPPPVDATEEAGTEPVGEQDDANVDATQSTAADTSAAQTTEPVKLTADEWFKQYAAEQFARQQQAQYAQQQQPVPQPAPAAQRSEPPPVLSKEDVETIQEFRKEWPDVAKALDVQQKAFANDLLTYVFNQFAEVMTPALQQVEAMSDRSHVADIYDFVPDYDQVREPVINWVGQLPPSAFRNYAVDVVNNGDPADIQGLVGQWRMFTGAPAPQQSQPSGYAPQAPRQAAPVRKQADPALARAAAAMAPVKSQRTTVVQADDPNDFDGAFERYAQQMRQDRKNFTARQ